jgi:RNA polymerase sigma-70 factor (ECF subfamily)
MALVRYTDEGMMELLSRVDSKRMPAGGATTVRDLIDLHYEFIWRTLRRLGIPAASVDDATQHVFWTASRKLDAIVPGRAKSFLFGIAVRVASDARRSAQRERERGSELWETREADLMGERVPLADELLDRKRMRARLDEFLDELSTEVRTAFVLFEAEGMTVPEIAELIGAPVGTIASRLRLARKQFNAMAERLRSAEARGVGT